MFFKHLFYAVARKSSKLALFCAKFEGFGLFALQQGAASLLYAPLLRRGGRVAECTGLENQQGLIAPREFKSLLLRHLYREAGTY